MKCVYCESEKTRISNSRPTMRSRRRNYTCEECGRSFATLEVPEEELPHRVVNSLRYGQTPPQAARPR